MTVGRSARIGLTLLGCALLCLASFALAESAREVVVRTSVDRSKVTVGDRIHYTVIVESPKGVKVIPPDIGVDLGHFEIKDYQVNESTEGDTQRLEVVYELATFETGKQVLPSMEVTYLVGKDRKTVRSDSLTLTVESLAPETAKDIRGPKPVVAVAPNWSGFRLVAGVLAGLLTLMVLLFWQLRRRRRGAGVVEPAEPPLPPHEVAFAELTRLRESTLLEEGQVKPFYSAVADALRRYLEGWLGIRALEQTTAEILDQLSGERLTPEQLTALSSLLNQCDLVKFAKFVPADPVSEGQHMVDVVWRFVEETRPALAEEEAEETPAEGDGELLEEAPSVADSPEEEAARHEEGDSAS